jgi:membrane peptidoglycan carboxypeptidase
LPPCLLAVFLSRSHGHDAPQARGLVDQRWVPMKDIAPALASAVVSAEDANF